MSIRVIYVPAVDEQIPDGGVLYTLPQSGKEVVDVIVDDNWDTDGEKLFEMDSAGAVLIPLTEPHIHHFAGWEA
jgi:hypothetical protein